MSRLGSQQKLVPSKVFFDVLMHSSVHVPTEDKITIPDPEPALVAALHATPKWFTPYLEYKTRGTLPTDEFLARQIAAAANPLCSSRDNCTGLSRQALSNVVSL